jgi:hypothetical protein
MPSNIEAATTGAAMMGIAESDESKASPAE